MMRDRAGLMPIGSGRDLAPAERVEIAPGGALAHEDHEHRHDRRATPTQSRKNALSLAKSMGPTTGRGTRERDRAAAHPVEGHEHALEHERERQGGEREVDPAEPQRGNRRAGRRRAAPSAAPSDERGEHRHVEAVDELRGGERADAGERRLAERHLAAHPGDDGDRQEDQAVHDAQGEAVQPVGVEDEQAHDHAHADHGERERTR